MSDSLPNPIDSGQDTISGQFHDASSNPQSSTASHLDLSLLLSYIKRVVSALMEDDGSVPISLKQLLANDSTHEILKKFIQEPQTKSILIQRLILKGNRHHYIFFLIDSSYFSFDQFLRR